MRPAARVQSAIEILDSVIDGARSGGAPADRILAEWFRNHRFAGSKDRRAIRDLVYDAIRACGPVPASGRAAMLRLVETGALPGELFDGSDYGPAVLGDNEAVAQGGVADPWLAEALAASGIEGDSALEMLARAPLDLRVNTLKASRDALDLPVETASTVAPQGLRLAENVAVEQWAEYRDGAIEIQDTGSQLACLSAGARPGENVVDLCAGAGGKTLQLAAQMENEGVIVACDVDRKRLSNLPPRAERAGVTNVSGLLLDPGKELDMLAEIAGEADLVLVDAPCSGTGTWRRKPDARWRLTPERLADFAKIQDRLLDIAAQLVRPGGRIHFVTCSLLDIEGKDRAEAFLARHPDWSALPLALPTGEARGDGWRLTPHRDGTDGFFIAGFVSP